MLIRSIAEEDYPQATDIHNAQNEPHWQTTPEQMQRSDEALRQNDPHYARYVAEEGKIVATGYLAQTWGGVTVPGRVWTGVFTRADRRNEGVDTWLLEHALAESESSIQEVWTCVRSDFVPMSGYLQEFKGGFQEQFRSFGSELHLSEFDAAKFAPLTERLKAEGVTLKRYAKLSGDPKRDENLLALHAATEADIPHHEPIIPSHYPNIHDPETDRSSAIVALQDERYIGYMSLEVDDRPDKTGIGFTGVLRPYRNRGVATALGAEVIELAKANGYTELGAGGAKENRPMQRVLRKLGFEIEPDWVTFAKK